MVIMGALMMVMLLAALDQTIVSTALPRIATDLHGLNKLSWVATAYLLTTAVTTPIYGKISDLFGRKKIFQSAIVIFLFGSVLCGLAQSMNQLVAARAIQGLGAGGLISLVLAIVGDIIPPRERGRYTGYFGAVFGISSVAGPLLGGFLTDSISWRGVFFVNLPLGAIALYLVGSRLHLPVFKREHKIDFLGVGLLTVASVCLLLATVWGGTTYAWMSKPIVSLIISGLVLAAVFIFWEHKPKEPLLPLELFRNRVFSVSVILSLLVGVLLFAAVLYIPLYQQIVRGYSPTQSGLLMLPLVGGMLITLVTVGRLTSHSGRYRKFPIIGTVILSVGLWLFSHLGLTTNQLVLSLWMVVIGIGLGCLMQIPTLAIQNSTESHQMGTATSTATFFRSLGSSFGGAIFGSILISRLVYHIQQISPQLTTKINTKDIESGAQLKHLPTAASHDVFLAFVRSFHDMFIVAIPFALLAFVFALLLPEVKLRSSHQEPVLE